MIRANQPSPGAYVDITPDELPSYLLGVRLIDVREPSEFMGALGRIPGAELVPLMQLEARARAWPKEQPILLVCRSGGRSARGAIELVQRGFTHVFNLHGGMQAYAASSLPIEFGT